MDNYILSEAFRSLAERVMHGQSTKPVVQSTNSFVEETKIEKHFYHQPDCYFIGRGGSNPHCTVVCEWFLRDQQGLLRLCGGTIDTRPASAGFPARYDREPDRLGRSVGPLDWGGPTDSEPSRIRNLGTLGTAADCEVTGAASRDGAVRESWVRALRYPKNAEKTAPTGSCCGAASRDRAADCDPNCAATTHNASPDATGDADVYSRLANQLSDLRGFVNRDMVSLVRDIYRPFALEVLRERYPNDAVKQFDPFLILALVNILVNVVRLINECERPEGVTSLDVIQDFKYPRIGRLARMWWLQWHVKRELPDSYKYVGGSSTLEAIVRVASREENTQIIQEALHKHERHLL